MAGREEQHPPTLAASAKHRWVPKAAFPSAARVAQGAEQQRIFPLPLPPRPVWKALKSSRLRKRQKDRLAVWRTACSMIAVLNGMAVGDVWSKLTCTADQFDAYMKTNPAGALAFSNLMKDAARETRERRGLGLTGVHSEAAAELLKCSADAQGYIKATGVKQVPLQAELVKEPASPKCLNMLEALPEEDRLFYEKEEHVVEYKGRSAAVFREIEQHYGFIGGEEEQYLRYLARPDCSWLFDWSLTSMAKATCGMSVVLKKDGISQRKLVMQCASNYMFTDVRQRADIGMGGGGSLARLSVPSDHLAISASDEDSAFTFVEVPFWMRAWQALPAVHAYKVWSLLPSSLQSQITDPLSTFVSPLYTRLAMGGSHSVYVLMAINLRSVGSALFGLSRRLAADPTSFGKSEGVVVDNVELEGDPMALLRDEQGELDRDELEDLLECPDENWGRRQLKRKSGPLGQAGYTVDGWCEAVRAAKRRVNRTMVVMHFFAGERRVGDIHHWLAQMCLFHGITLLMVSVDLEFDQCWDFTVQTTFHKIAMLAIEGLLDIVLGGPPCSTVARIRHLPLPGGGGPRPLRYRWCLWGRLDLRPHERVRVVESNTLWIHMMAISELVSSRGGAHLIEHPGDPGRAPFASMWATPEMLGMEARTSAVRALFHQCCFGGITAKFTCMSGTLDDLCSLDGIWCPGLSATHTHGRSSGQAEDGSFYTRRLQRYPEPLCKFIADLMVRTLIRFLNSHAGPTGALSEDGSQPCRRITSWSTSAAREGVGITLLNEATARGFSTKISSKQSAAYIHVDDCVCISDGCDKSNPLHANQILRTMVHALEQTGFSVSTQETDETLEKIVGYVAQRKPATFRLPGRKSSLLKVALMELASQRQVFTPVLRSLLGIWLFGGLLKRELLSVPHAVFRFIDQHEDTLARWWQSARREVVAMAHCVAFFELRLGAKLLPLLCATDAMGVNEHDYGGYGICITDLGQDETDELLTQSEAPGRVVSRLSDFEGVASPDKPLFPTKPFSLLSDRFFKEERWLPVEASRWRFGDHITLGEARTVKRMLEILTSFPGVHDSLMFSLQDNMPTACSMTKGRSTSFPLNRILRQKGAITIAAKIRLRLPWTESAKMPADELSRILTW